MCFCLLFCFLLFKCTTFQIHVDLICCYGLSADTLWHNTGRLCKWHMHSVFLCFIICLYSILVSSFFVPYGFNTESSTGHSWPVSYSYLCLQFSSKSTLLHPLGACLLLCQYHSISIHHLKEKEQDVVLAGVIFPKIDWKKDSKWARNTKVDWAPATLWCIAETQGANTNQPRCNTHVPLSSTSCGNPPLR